MTTTVIVKANHGWPVDVTALTVDGGRVAERQQVAIGDEQSFIVHSGQDLLVHEAQPTDTQKAAYGEHILQFFAWEHLPPHLQDVSRPFGLVAARIVATLPRNPERTVSLRKLLEAKDAAVRAVVAKQEA